MPFLSSCLACIAVMQAASAPLPPKEAGAPVPAGAAYVSPFADYRRFDPEAPSKPWRKANEEVLESGGHVGLVKGRAGPAPAAPAAAPAAKAAPMAPEKAAAPHSHGGHR